MASHEPEWLQAGSDFGFYKFPENSPFFFDGAERPINESVIFASAFVSLYMVTQDFVFLERAVNIWNRYKQYMTRDQFRYIAYSYNAGKLFEGWTLEDNVSINTPVFNPSIKNKYETFHKAAITLNFMIPLSEAGFKEVDRYLEEFYYVLLASLNSSSPTAKFPAKFGFGYPLNSHHIRPPYVLDGWLRLVSQNDEFARYALETIDDNQFDARLYLSYLTGLSRHALRSVEVVISPRFLDESDVVCPFVAPVFG